MEIAVDSRIPTYSGGLGVLAGDTLRAAADLKVPLVGVTLLHRKGYFHQRIDPGGWQVEEPEDWAVAEFMTELPQRVTVVVEGRAVEIRSWRYDLRGDAGSVAPVYFLDADLEENSDWDRTLTHFFYGGDQRYRLAQETILGIGGARMLRAIGYRAIERFHMNEGHAGLLALELLDEEAKAAGRTAIDARDIETVRRKCIFTTHTPVAAGQDQFPIDLARHVLGRDEVQEMKEVFCWGHVLNMTYLALNLSHYVNGVAKKHGEVSRLLFAGYNIDSITNGVHAATWAAPPFGALYDCHIPGWKLDNFSLRYALSIPREEIWKAHAEAKGSLVRFVNRRTEASMDPDVLTLGFARRATAYKRGDLLFSDPERLRRIASQAGGLQVVYAGKAHPQDRTGKELIQRIFQAIESLRGAVKIAYPENYDLDLGKLLTAGADVWLNTPEPPLEASGTSGIKAALNGVPSLSIPDGW